MSWRFRKVLNFGPLRTSWSKTGVGYSVGFQGLRYGVSPNGKKYISIGVPGTGVYWLKYFDDNKRASFKKNRTINYLSSKPNNRSRFMINNDFSEQIPFGSDSFADNPEPRCPCLLLIDTSGSMSGAPIAELNTGLLGFKDELLSDSLAAKRVEIALISFGPVSINNDFITAFSFYPPTLSATGDTPMGEAIRQGIELVRKRKDDYRNNGISFYRPWIFLITDGAPTDEWQSAGAMIREGENSKSFAFFAVGVKGANMDILRQISVREPLKLEGLKFRELFQWLSNSMKNVSSSVPGTVVPIEAPLGWTEV